MKLNVSIITLNPDSSKVQELLNLIEGQNLNAEIVSGVDGRKDFPLLEDGESVDQAKSSKMRLVELTKSEVGCYLSHFRIIKDAYSKGLERICILEDDVLIEPDFGRVLSMLKALPEKFEHIRLMGLKLHRRKIISKLGNNHQLTRPIKGLCGTQGYIINRSGMNKVLQHGRVISKPIDKFYDHFWETNLKSYCVEPHIIWERPIVESSIMKLSVNEAARPFNKLLRKHIVKLYSGLKRRFYIFKQYNDFSPAKKPTKAMGKTARIH